MVPITVNSHRYASFCRGKACTRTSPPARSALVGLPRELHRTSLPHDMLLFSEASKEGRGSYLQGAFVLGCVVKGLNLSARQCFRDLGSIVSTLSVFKNTDSHLVVAYVTKLGGGGMVSGSLCQLSAIATSTRYIPGKRNTLVINLVVKVRLQGFGIVSAPLYSRKAVRVLGFWIYSQPG